MSIKEELHISWQLKSALNILVLCNMDGRSHLSLMQGAVPESKINLSQSQRRHFITSYNRYLQKYGERTKQRQILIYL